MSNLRATNHRLTSADQVEKVESQSKNEDDQINLSSVKILEEMHNGII